MGAETHEGEAPAPAVRFETHPSRYRHLRLTLEDRAGAGKIARITLDVKEDGGLRPGYVLKLNSYDLGVDLELADALQRVRFEHPEVRAIVFASDKDRIFCSGANIYMLGTSTHAFKVNFCKFTNETRLGLEEMSAESGIPSLAALSGTASGGGYELAIACDEIVLQDDGSSAVSLPEAPLLGVLPGTGGLTRLVDKRKVRRDLADVFSTTAEGVRGKRALEWGLVDEAPSRGGFRAAVEARLAAMVARSGRRPHSPVVLAPLEPRRAKGLTEYKYVTLALRPDRTATLTVQAPHEVPDGVAAFTAEGAESWAIRAFRELDDALLDLRFNAPEIGVVALETRGDVDTVLAYDAFLAEHASDGLVHETRLLIRRTLRRLDLTAKSLFALVTPGSAFAGTLLELALAADRIYMKDASEGASAEMALSAANAGAYTMSNGLSRLAQRFLGQPTRATELLAAPGKRLSAPEAMKAGLVTFAPDDLDWDDEVRIAFEERASLSPDALTGMEASLRFGGPETLDTKIFGRLTAWQNWIFSRPNAVGEKGALTLYGSPERAVFDYRRT